MNEDTLGLSDEEIDSLFHGARNPASTVEGFRLNIRAVIAADRARQNKPKVCCQEFNSCKEACAPRAEYWREIAIDRSTQVVAAPSSEGVSDEPVHMLCFNKYGTVEAEATVYAYERNKYEGDWRPVYLRPAPKDPAPKAEGPSGKHAECFRAFSIHSEAWYHKTSWVPDVIDEIMIGMYHPEGGTTGEFGIRWTELGGKATPRLEVFDDAWSALHLFGDLLAWMADVDNKNVTPQEVAAKLRSLGVGDRTSRINPHLATSTTPKEPAP